MNQIWSLYIILRKTCSLPLLYKLCIRLHCSCHWWWCHFHMYSTYTTFLILCVIEINNKAYKRNLNSLVNQLQSSHSFARLQSQCTITEWWMQYYIWWWPNTVNNLHYSSFISATIKLVTHWWVHRL